jgi:hypothetical protein
MIQRGYKNIEQYPNFLRNYKACEVKCTFIKENGNFLLSFEGYINGIYTNSNPINILKLFRKCTRELPVRIPITLEKKIDDSEDGITKLLLVALESFGEDAELYRGRIRESFH